MKVHVLSYTAFRVLPIRLDNPFTLIAEIPEALRLMVTHSEKTLALTYSDKLELVLNTKKVWHRFIEFSEPVKTVEQAASKVHVEKIAKSIVMVDSAGDSLLAIVPAKSKVSHKKLKSILGVRDVRLATPEEVLRHSGYPAGGVPPFSNISRILLDPQVLEKETAIVGGGDVNKLLEVRTGDIIAILSPKIADISQT